MLSEPRRKYQEFNSRYLRQRETHRQKKHRNPRKFRDTRIKNIQEPLTSDITTMQDARTIGRSDEAT